MPARLDPPPSSICQKCGKPFIKYDKRGWIDRKTKQCADCNGATRNLFGIQVDEAMGRGGGVLPSLRTTYSIAQRKALFDLAESNPTPAEYERRKKEILKT